MGPSCLPWMLKVQRQGRNLKQLRCMNHPNQAKGLQIAPGIYEVQCDVDSFPGCFLSGRRDLQIAGMLTILGPPPRNPQGLTCFEDNRACMILPYIATLKPACACAGHQIWETLPQRQPIVSSCTEVQVRAIKSTPTSPSNLMVRCLVRGM